MADEAQAGGDRSWRSSEKSIQKAIQRLSARLLGCQRHLEDRKRLTQTMTFEDLGVDRAFVDEWRNVSKFHPVDLPGRGGRVPIQLDAKGFIKSLQTWT